MISDDAKRDVHGPPLTGAHKNLEFFAQGLAMEGGQSVPFTLPQEILDEINGNSDEWRASLGEALVKVIRAAVGSDSELNTRDAIGGRLEELLRQIDKEHKVPPHRQRTKQARSQSAKKFFKNLGMDRLRTARSRPDDERKAVADGVKEWWRRRKRKPSEMTPTASMNSNPTTPLANQSTDGGAR